MTTANLAHLARNLNGSKVGGKLFFEKIWIKCFSNFCLKSCLILNVYGYSKFAFRYWYFIYEYIDCCSLLFVASENATCWVGLNFAIFLLCNRISYFTNKSCHLVQGFQNINQIYHYCNAHAKPPNLISCI